MALYFIGRELARSSKKLNMYPIQFYTLNSLMEVTFVFFLKTYLHIVIYFRDVKTGEIVFAHVNLEFAETMWYSSFSLKLKAPCILPGGF